MFVFSAYFHPSRANSDIDALRIAQIDNSLLLVNQLVKVYLSATDREGNPVPGLRADNFSLIESPEGGGASRRGILSFQQGANINQGIKLLLVLDNSGSMYWDGSGKIKDSDDERIWRITYAKAAVLSLLKEIKNPLDRVGFVSFNVKIEARVRPTSDKARIGNALKEVRKPSETQAYTELYEALYESVGYLKAFGGRKVILVLSDGQNFPMKNNPNFPARRGLERAVEYAQREGISVFAIGLSEKADRTNLNKIARETGGAYFSTNDPEELAGLYALIRNQVLNEYLLTYRTGMEPAQKKLLKVQYRNARSLETARFYFSGTLFGLPAKRIDFQILLFIPVALISIWLLTRAKFERKKAPPSLNVLTVAGRKRAQTLALTGEKKAVTIGGAASDDFTIAGDPTLKQAEAFIEQKNGVYTLKADKTPVTVNKRPVKTKTLRSGDVIQVGNTTIIFDAGTDIKKQKRKS